MRDKLKDDLEALKNNKTLADADLENLLIQTYRLLESEDPADQNACLAVICHVADRIPADAMVRQLLHDVIVKSRVFMYEDLLKQTISNYLPTLTSLDRFSSAVYTSNKTKTVLNKYQKQVFDTFQRHRRLIVSAPTSFGKTRIIKEIIAHNDFNNIVLIMPTVSLLSELYQDIKNSVPGYAVSKSSKVKIEKNEKNVLILTPERMNVFFEVNPTFVPDFFVMDEIYKLDYKLDDGRFRVFSDVLMKLAATGSDFYLMGPYISRFSRRFLEVFSVGWMRFEIEVVQKDFYDLDNEKQRGQKHVGEAKIRVVGDKFKNLLRLISSESIDGKYLIYRYQKQYVEETATKILSTWPPKPHNEALVTYLAENVSPEWDLIACIKRGVAFHHGAMPRHIQDLIVDEFNDQSEKGINYLFCTTSLTEGVNTSAKNVVLYDKKIGRGDNLGALDRRNIEGRAGRLLKHFVGRVFYLEAPEDTKEEIAVELEVFDSANPSAEVLLATSDNHMSDENRGKREELIDYLRNEGVPISLIKNNKFVDIQGQIGLYSELSQSPKLMRDIHFDGNFPNLDKMKLILNLSYSYLFSESDKGRNFSGDKGRDTLIGLTDYYIYHKPTFYQLLHSSTAIWARPRLNSRIRYVFDLVSKYFEFTWPKYLKAFEAIYNAVALEQDNEIISLDMVIAQLEYGTTQPHEIILRDAGLPNEIVRKVSPAFVGCEDFDDVRLRKTQSRDQIRRLVENIENKIIDKYI